MTIREMISLLREFPVKLKVDYDLFNQWLWNIKYVSEELEKKYDHIYAKYFYVLIVEAINQGVPYTKIKVAEDSLSEGEEYLALIHKHLCSLLDDFTDSERKFIFYRRDSVSHIFTESYENRLQDDKVKKTRKGENITKLRNELFSVLAKYGSEEEFDKHFRTVMSTRIKKLFLEVQSLRKKYT
jgi:hypothetical protein